MGLKLRYNLFFAVTQHVVYKTYADFWMEHGYHLTDVPTRPLAERDFATYTLYRSDGYWTLLDWCGGWEWDLRRQAQLHVSQALGCPGLLVFEFDGDYWGYELFASGEVLDHFVQRPSEANTWFPNSDCRGNPERFAAAFRPWLKLSVKQLAAYLVQEPEDSRDYDCLNRLVRGGDEFPRFAPCSSVNFLRFLGLRVAWREYQPYKMRYLTPLAPVWRSFQIVNSVASEMP
jgi:hypothetical protein